MPSLEKHVELSLQRTGRDFRQVHEWLDGKNLTFEERLARHDISRIPEFLPIVEKQFGKQGAREYLQHLKDDFEKNFLLKAFPKLKNWFEKNKGW